MAKPHDATAEFERALTQREGTKLSLRLFVAGTTPRSLRAVVNLRRLCEEHFPGHFDIEVIDIYQQPGRAREHQILVVPTLIRELPAPARRIVGDLSNTAVVLAALRQGLPRIDPHATKTEPTKTKPRKR